MSNHQITHYLRENSLAWIATATYFDISQRQAMTYSTLLQEKVSKLAATTLASWTLLEDNELPFTTEIISHKGIISVITHHKRVLGKGFHSTVTASIAYMRFDFGINKELIRPGTFLVSKTFTNSIFREREEKITSLFTDADHIRQIAIASIERQRPNELLLIGMQASLKTLSEQRHSFDKDEKIEIAIQLLYALKTLQAQSIVHRDLHMENCGLSYDGRWLVHDFSCAAKEGEVVERAANLAIATIRQLDGPHKLSCHDDLWGLGLILFEIVHRVQPEFCKVAAIEKVKNAIIENDTEGIVHHKKLMSAFIEDLKKKSSIKTPFDELIVALLEGASLDDCIKMAESLDASSDIESPSSGDISSSSDSEVDALCGYLEALQ